MLIALILQTATPSAQAVRVDPTWARKPSPEQVMGVYPVAALNAGAAGRAVIDCAVSLDGSLRNCRLKSETPEGLGFGNAALALAIQLDMRPGTVGGVPVDGARVTIPINFNPGEAPPNGSRRNVIVAAPWTSAPTVEQVASAYPKTAKENGRSGEGFMTCVVDGVGLLRNCLKGWHDDPDGFNNAALALAPRFRMARRMQGAATADARVDVRVMFSTLPSPPLDTRPVWVRTPTADEAFAALPSAAREAGVARLTVVEHCTVAADGALEGYSTARQEPEVAGGAEAAARLLPVFRMSVWSATGRPTAGSSLNLPIVWDVPALKAATMPTP